MQKPAKTASTAAKPSRSSQRTVVLASWSGNVYGGHDLRHFPV
jgi:hypothetical protein